MDTASPPVLPNNDRITWFLFLVSEEHCRRANLSSKDCDATVQIISSECPPIDTSGCYSKTLLWQPHPEGRINCVGSLECWKNDEYYPGLTYHLTHCLQAWKLWILPLQTARLYLNEAHHLTIFHMKFGSVWNGSWCFSSVQVWGLWWNHRVLFACGRFQLSYPKIAAELKTI